MKVYSVKPIVLKYTLKYSGEGRGPGGQCVAAVRQAPSAPPHVLASLCMAESIDAVDLDLDESQSA